MGDPTPEDFSDVANMHNLGLINMMGERYSTINCDLLAENE
jgi:hypothetical protein